jgi:beta-glucosidase
MAVFHQLTSSCDDIRDRVSSAAHPVKELKDFQRVSLKAGETKKVVLELTPEKLAFHNVDMKLTA